jgi:diaminohydroxyphosphoribosylaminopyrimidine deaminase/5-amino-6-(5-phosphoribosylamino)uracil reductase
VVVATTDTADADFMRIALGLAARGLGRTWPNPAVGCLLVRDGHVVARGWTQAGGRPHAETEALGRAGALALGATAYVTLEPCSHHGATPPCAEALIRAGIARAVVALEDPDLRVSGRGIAALEQAGIAVTKGTLAAAAAALNAGFLQRVRSGRPLVTLKLATSLDGRIATHSGQSKWITGEPARARAHLLRAEHDAVMIGAMTACIDDPELTCRLPGLTHRSPVRVVVDGRLQLPLTSRLVQDAEHWPTWLVTGDGGDPERRDAYLDCGLELIEVGRSPAGLPDLYEALQALGERGLTRVLTEGGSRLAASLARADLIDRVAWFRAPLLIGGDGVPALEAFGLNELGDAPRFRRTGVSRFGEDLLECFERNPEA